uniref:Uncharacterized protein n=1 Tax=Bacillus subtilis TaxID=1423 RepID=A0A1J0AKY1_BACIU|nr:hypothetical protein pBS72_1210 [Bacillus subtilis]
MTNSFKREYEDRRINVCCTTPIVMRKSMAGHNERRKWYNSIVLTILRGGLLWQLQEPLLVSILIIMNHKKNIL